MSNEIRKRMPLVTLVFITVAAILIWNYCLSQRENGYAPKENGYLPKEIGYAPKEIGYAPKENGYAPKESKGYVFAFWYWEQQGTSLFSLLTLQCWTGLLNASMSVAAPYYTGGWPATNSYLHKTQATKFSDLFDLQVWNNVTMRKYGVDLVPFLYFLKHTHIKIVTVEIIYWWKKSLDAKGLSRNKRIKTGCQWRIENSDSFYFSFTIMRRACINFSFGDKITASEFNDLIFGSISPEEVSVIFREWRGISTNPFRIPIDLDCGDTFTIAGESTSPSSRILEIASEYKHKYLKNSDYIAVMLRLEKAIESHPLEQLGEFLQKVLNTYKNLQYRSRIFNNLLLSLDIGRFGSSTLGNTRLLALGRSFFDKVTEGKKTVKEWESSFETVAKTKEPAVIARLQSVLVAQSTCAIIAGGGTFQFHTISLYRSLQRSSDPCLEVM